MFVWINIEQEALLAQGDSRRQEVALEYKLWEKFGDVGGSLLFIIICVYINYYASFAFASRLKI